MYNGNKIKELLAARNLTNKELLSFLGVECNSSITQLTNGNPTVRKIEKVADFFGVSIDTFFDRDEKFSESKDSNDSVKLLREKILFLEKLIEEKNRNIFLLEQFNAYLSGQNRDSKK